MHWSWFVTISEENLLKLTRFKFTQRITRFRSRKGIVRRRIVTPRQKEIVFASMRHCHRIYSLSLHLILYPPLPVHYSKIREFADSIPIQSLQSKLPFLQHSTLNLRFNPRLERMRRVLPSSGFNSILHSTRRSLRMPHIPPRKRSNSTTRRKDPRGSRRRRRRTCVVVPAGIVVVAGIVAGAGIASVEKPS